MSRKEKSKFEFEEKKFNSLLKREVCRRFCLEDASFSNKLNFFCRIQILIFLRETTQNYHNRLLYKFENDQKYFSCVGSCGYAPASVKDILLPNLTFSKGQKKIKSRRVKKQTKQIRPFVFWEKLADHKLFSKLTDL